MRSLRGVVREAVAASRSQPVASLISVAIVAGMVASVLLTTGRTVGSEQAVIGSIDSAGTRSILVRAEQGSGLDSSVLRRLENIEGIAWAGAFGAAHDVTNSAIPGSVKVPVRSFWSTQMSAFGIPPSPSLPGKSAWASTKALDELGMTQPSGGLTDESGDDLAVVGELEVPDYLTFLEPLVVVPNSSPEDAQPVTVLVVIADRPDLVAPLSGVVASVLGVSDPTMVSVTTSENLATLRALIEGQLGSFGRELALLIFGVSAVLVAAILYGLVMLRRKDFGRRRALGASQPLILALLLIQMALLGTGGALIGTAIAALGLVLGGDPLPGFQFTVAVNVLAVSVAVVAAIAPALAAARRDPLTELRVP